MGIASYTLLPKAVSDLENIWSYSVETWSREQADIYIRQLNTKFEDIAAGRAPVKDVGDIRKGYFRCGCGSHFIFFKVKSDRPEIIRILHQRMNVDAHL